MLLYSHTTTPRLQYVARFLSQYYGQPVNITTDKAKYRAAPDACKVAYSTQPVLTGEVWIVPQGLLFEKGITPVLVHCFEFNGSVAFFKTGGTFPFDLLAAVFYLLSRYEEYGPHKPDLYGRYAYQNSTAFKLNFLKNPLVNIWLEDFRKLLRQKDDQFAGSSPVFSFQPTYDIDIAWSYKAKGLTRTAGGLMKAAVSGRWRTVAERTNVLRGKQPDPFDAYAWMQQLHQKYSLNPLFFFLVAAQRSRYDKNTTPRNKLFQTLIRNTAALYPVGLHPSWQSGDKLYLLEAEKEMLEGIMQQPVTASRQHYIRLSVPQTYRQLLAVGITNDYSMGYGSINGFRASIATPFYWYDLEAEQETTLLLHPFCFMDANAYYEQQQSAEETWEELQYYHHVVKRVGGSLYTIWHNPFLGPGPAFKNWRAVYERFVALVCS